MFHSFVAWFADTVGQWGYPGIILLMALESSFFPFPSEVVIPPAAYLATTGKMNMGMVVLCGTLGSLVGAVFNYWLAMTFGRPFFEKYGRYLLISPESLEKADRFFAHHGPVSMFTGRLLPVIRQYISLPAGLARMNLAAFCTATVLGAGLWVLVLTGLGYWFGKNEALVLQNLHWATLSLAAGCGVACFFHWRKWQRRSRSENHPSQ
ncbi:DedA family protein [uncultured Desulfobacter sp.]|uniref:DedA family protein n=1 Tax=uncultured Desulfobacter sp. TaxID=240139 RepID=UPI0029F55BF6|nr:DedA family protein [uncultured Desulfobacter sp.]